MPAAAASLYLIGGARAVMVLLATIVLLGAGVWSVPVPGGNRETPQGFLDHLSREFDRSRRHGHPFVLARCQFDTAGAAERALAALAGVLRQTDVVGRRASDLFLLLPETDVAGADALLARLQASGEGHRRAVTAAYPADGMTVGGLLELVLGAGGPAVAGDRSAAATDPFGATLAMVAPADARLAAVPARRPTAPAVALVDPGDMRAKRLVDLVALGLLAPLLLPVAALVALAVRLDSPGRALFLQRRTGRYGHRFGMYKFRTMVANAEELKESLQHLNILDPPDFKIVDDPRITRTGKVLRATSLDELPQLWNIFTGDMTLVGPRPTSFAASTYEPWHTQRLEVTPGITGLWQVSSRHNSGFDERLRLDVAYIRSMSVRTDARIIGQTFGSVLKARGA
ncbi:MAG: sugar transferase [Acidimicrobiia bacterium]